MTHKYRYFVAGTDTGVGKTCVSAAILTLAAAQGLSTLGLKPVAAGCEQTDAGLRNDDALTLADVATCKLPYAQVNPLALEDAVSPHLAAAKIGKRVSAERLVGFCRGAMMAPHEFCIVEGAGGWRVPISLRETMADFAGALGLPVILVVGLRLGCLNHALLSAEAIIRDGMRLVGWVANTIDHHMEMREENIDSLRTLLPCPCLGVIPHIDSGDYGEMCHFLDIRALISPE